MPLCQGRLYHNSANLFESELFGMEEGAFNETVNYGKIGLMELADKGTIFFDQIDGMPFEIQIKLKNTWRIKSFINPEATINPYRCENNRIY